MQRTDWKFGFKRHLHLGIALGMVALTLSAGWTGSRMAASGPCLAFVGTSLGALSVKGTDGYGIFRRLYPAGEAIARTNRGDDQSRYLHVATLSHNLGQTLSAEDRKTAFVSAVLPMVLSVNEAIMDRRRVVDTAVACRAAGRDVGPALQARILRYHELYGTDGDTAALLNRMDIVPPSLAIAQAAIESGWGQSRFATTGNALFGQRTTNPDRGMRPAALPETTTVRVAAFGRPIESVRSYIHNLNTYPAYQAFRDRRAALRRSGGESDGLTLAGTLVAYSTRGQAYVRDLQSIIRANRLAAFDTVAPATMPRQHTSGSDT